MGPSKTKLLPPRPPWAAALVLLPLFLALACGDEKREAGGGPSGRLSVATSLPLFADLISQVGGERVEVFALLPAGADPHTYEPSPQDIQKVSEARLVIVNGLGLETPLLRVIEPNLAEGALLLRLAEEALTAGLPLAQSAVGEEEGAAGGNPHLWLDVNNAREYARIIRDALSMLDPEGASHYEANYQQFLAELAQLDSYARGLVTSLPPERRKLVTSHDAFPYLARYLDLEEVGFIVPSPGQEASPADLAALVGAIQQQEVPAVFAEPQLDPQSRLLQQIADDADVQLCTLYSDAFDQRVRTYVEMMRFNVDELARCLGESGD